MGDSAIVKPAEALTDVQESHQPGLPRPSRLDSTAGLQDAFLDRTARAERRRGGVGWNPKSPCDAPKAGEGPLHPASHAAPDASRTGAFLLSRVFSALHASRPDDLIRSLKP